MKKIFTSLIAGTVIAAAGIEVKANQANSDLQNVPFCDPLNYEQSMMDISDGVSYYLKAFDVAECYGYQVDAIDQNVTDIYDNLQDINTNTTNITTNTDAIASNGDDITGNTLAIESLNEELNSIEGGGGGGSSVAQAKEGSDTTTVIGDENRNILEIGTGENATKIDQSGMSVNGQNLISTDENGVTKIGANSLNMQTVNGKENLWATDGNGKIIPINITNGSKLLINGRDVEQSINNVGALSAALTGLPTVPTDTTLACGFGTGTHGGDFAFSGGCASKVNEKLSINYAASMTMPTQDYAGDFEDKFSARAGFVWQLGKSTKPTQISFKDKKFIENKISSLEKNNDELKAKNVQIISQNQKLLARLEKLEKLTLALKLNPDTEVISLAK